VTRFALALVCTLLLAGYGIADAPQVAKSVAKPPNVSSSILKSQLWCDYLRDPLWIQRDAYDAAHALLIPLEHAFAFNDGTLKNCFSTYVRNLQRAVNNREVDPGRLNWLQHLHLVARYLVLSNDIESAAWVLDEFTRLWNSEPAWLWARDPFPGIRDRIEWKLESSGEPLARSYYNVIFDEDYFAMSLGLDLYGLYSRAGRLEECGDACKEARLLFLRVFSERTKWHGDRWLIDVGRWDDHPDFSYSQYYVPPVSPKGETLPPHPRRGGVIDSSHAHRYPSWLRSAQLALKDERDYIERLRRGLSQQFSHVILVQDQGRIPLLNNYMDGHNGWFRWNYATHTGVLKGYGPYALSGTFSFGWWSLLGGEEIAAQYERLAKSIPLTDTELQLYAGSSTRTRHPLIEEGWSNGLMADIAWRAAELARHVE
jgi:hypothetical protein